VTAEKRRELLARYREGPDVLEAAVAGLTDAQLDAPAPDGGWSPRQVVHHCADSELTSAVRLRRLLAEDRPVITGYDEMEFSRRLHYDRPVASSLAAYGWTDVSMRAAARVIAGTVHPTGRLPVEVPRADDPATALYPIGYGLGY